MLKELKGLKDLHKLSKFKTKNGEISQYETVSDNYNAIQK